MTDIPLSPSSSVPPSAPPPSPPQQRDLLTPGMIEALRATKPWVRFLAILGFVAVGFMVVLALGVGGVGVYQISKGSNEGYVMAGMALLYLVFGGLYIFPSRFLFRYASAIREALDARWKSAAVEKALGYQKSFWKFAGIMTLISLLLYIPGILAAIAIPNLLTAMQRSKQKRSMADMRTIATALEAYATDTDGYPTATSIDELAPLLEPKYVQRVPRLDGWGKPFVYEPALCESSRCGAYYIASGGKNGSMEKAPSQYGLDFTGTTNFDEDLVFANGSFTRAPQGVK